MPQPTKTPPRIELLSPTDLRERDVDLLLREELYVSKAFQRFFSMLGGDFRGSRFVRARHSVDRYAGESDLEVDVTVAGHSIRLLIEDKIDAQFQKGQAERYVKAGEDYVTKLECNGFATVLVAPKSYLAGSDHGFGKTMGLERIQDFPCFVEICELDDFRHLAPEDLAIVFTGHYGLRPGNERGEEPVEFFEIHCLTALA
jgi:hypothetical protein